MRTDSCLLSLASLMLWWLYCMHSPPLRRAPQARAHWRRPTHPQSQLQTQRLRMCPARSRAQVHRKLQMQLVSSSVTVHTQIALPVLSVTGLMRSTNLPSALQVHSRQQSHQPPKLWGAASQALSLALSLFHSRAWLRHHAQHNRALCKQHRARLRYQLHLYRPCLQALFQH